jgi:hypothetical protein
MARAMPTVFIASAPLTTGTIRPASYDTAMPMFTYRGVTMESPSNRELICGNACSASTVARTTNGR